MLYVIGFADKVATTNKALQPGMHMITKPVSLDVLADRLKEIIDQD